MWTSSGGELEESLKSSVKLARFQGFGYREYFPSGAYVGLSSDNHSTFCIGLNTHININNEIRITNTHPTNAGVAICMPGNGQPNQGGMYFFTKNPTSVTAGDVAYDLDTSVPSMMIDSSGNVGIGTRSPYTNLHINKGIGSDVWNTSFKPTDCHLYLGGYEWGAVGTTLKFGFGYIDRSDGNIPCYMGARVESTLVDGEYAIVFGTRNSNVDSVVPEERMCITHDGNVGIGTTSPYSKLEITAGADKSHIRISEGSHNNSSSTFLYPALTYYARQDNIRRNYDPFNQRYGASASISFTDRPGTYTYANAVRSSDIVFHTATSYVSPNLGHYPIERMRISANGNVGIGTTSPNEILHVIGNAVFQQPSSSPNYTSSSTHGINLIPYGGDSGGNAGGRIFFDETINGLHNYGFSLGYNGGSDNDILNWKANTFNINRHENSVNGATVLTINRANGNVGIGTNNATGGKLHVVGDIFTTGKILGEVGGSKLIVGGTTYQSATAPTNGMLVEGNVGIGTWSPQGQLSLYKSGNNGGELWFGNSDINAATSKNYGKISFNTYLGGGVPYRNIAHIRCVPYGSNYGGDIIFNTYYDANGGSDRMVIRGNGNVGIGTTDPGYKLQVNGTFNATGSSTFNGSIYGESNVYISDHITHINDTDTKFGFNAADQFEVRVGGNQKIATAGGNIQFGGASDSGLAVTLPSGNTWSWEKLTPLV